MSLPVLAQADLEFAAAALSIDLAHPSQREAFLRMASMDVQAVPGSGKTTLLAAKLVALARIWGARRAGVCVLSHTNVAHREVSSRIEAIREAQHFLHPPHFIGTFQQFAHQFLALPCIRQRGIESPRIDDDGFAVVAAKVCTQSAFKAAYTYFEMKSERPGGGVEAFSKVEYLNADFGLGLAGKPIDLSPETKTYQQLRTFKQQMSKWGIFRFRDMFAVAERQLRDHPELAAILRRRFPLLVVDEVQDTEEQQGRLLDTIFDETVIVQRFGDVNQKIYSGPGIGGCREPFPAHGHIVLLQTKRFGESVARVASRLSLTHPVEITGLPRPNDLPPVLLLFDDNSISQVLPRFAELVVGCLPFVGQTPPVAKAVGLRVRTAQDDDDPPRSVGHYWSEFGSQSPAAPARSPSMCDYAVSARAAYQQQLGSAAPVALLRTGIEAAFRAASRNLDVTTGIVPRETELRSLHRSRWLDYRRAVLELFRGPEPSETGWPLLRSALLDPFAVGDGVKVVQRAMLDGHWEAVPVTPPESAVRGTARGVYRFTAADGRTLPIEVASIHAVKGETHDATLVLETFHYAYDLKELLPLIAGSANPPKRRGGRTPKPPGVRQLDRARSVFVAASRPRYLLAFAAHVEHAAAHELSAIGAEGWTVLDLR